MKVRQGEIVEVNFLLPNGGFKPHPVIVISNNIVNEYEEAFIGVMISGASVSDDFTYLLANDMLTRPAKKACQVRSQLISMIPENQVIGKHGSVKKKYLQEIIEKIFDNVLNVD